MALVWVVLAVTLSEGTAEELVTADDGAEEETAEMLDPEAGGAVDVAARGAMEEDATPSDAAPAPSSG